MSKLSLKSLSRSFSGFKAVDNISLDLVDGEFVSLLGPSGCGKTTTLRMVAGFIPPSGGTIEMNGRALSSPTTVVPPEKRQMSMIFQSYAIWPNMTVAENVAFGLGVRKLPRRETETRVDRILDIVRLRQLAGRYPSELSGGQQQRVALARAIVVEPQILLLDEPLSNLDANLREEMRFEIRRLHDEFKITSVYVTHDQSEAMVTSDRIVVMNQGRIEQASTPVELYARPKTRFVASFIGKTNLIDARSVDGRVVFDGGAWPLTAFGAAPPGKSFQLSIRPHDVKLGRGPQDGAFTLKGLIAERAYLGDAWDYAVVVDGGQLRLRATTTPRDIFEIGDAVSCTFDPKVVAMVE
jgi:iron(III) transport system ATP-binding protein